MPDGRRMIGEAFGRLRLIVEWTTSQRLAGSFTSWEFAVDVALAKDGFASWLQKMKHTMKTNGGLGGCGLVEGTPPFDG